MPVGSTSWRIRTDSRSCDELATLARAAASSEEPIPAPSSRAWISASCSSACCCRSTRPCSSTSSSTCCSLRRCSKNADTKASVSALASDGTSASDRTTK
jgi:hypothetical protein